MPVMPGRFLELEFEGFRGDIQALLGNVASGLLRRLKGQLIGMR